MMPAASTPSATPTRCGRHARLALRDGDAFGPAPRGLAEVFARGDEEVGL